MIDRLVLAQKCVELLKIAEDWGADMRTALFTFEVVASQLGPMLRLELRAKRADGSGSQWWRCDYFWTKEQLPDHVEPIDRFEETTLAAQWAEKLVEAAREHPETWEQEAREWLCKNRPWPKEIAWPVICEKCRHAFDGEGNEGWTCPKCGHHNIPF